MATQLFFQNANPDCHLGTNNARLTGVGTIGWVPKVLATTRGSVTQTFAVATVAGPTAGLEISANISTFYMWISPPVDADVTIAGTITLNLWASETNMSANCSINAVIEVIRANALGTVNSNTLVEIARSTRTVEVAVTTPDVHNFTVTPTSTVVNRGDRIRIRVFADDSTANMGSGFSCSFAFSGPTAAVSGDSYVTFAETFSFESAPAGSQVFLTDTASDVATASVDRAAWTTRGGGVVSDIVNTAAGFLAPIQLTDTAGGTVVDWFTPQLAAVTLTGMAQANLRALESNAAAQASMRCEIARVESDGTSPTIWADWCVAPFSGQDGGEVASVSEDARTAWVSGDDLAISDGQRLRIRIYIDDIASSAMVTGHTVQFFYNGTSAAASGDSYVIFPVTLTELAPAAGIPRYGFVDFADPGVL